MGEVTHGRDKSGPYYGRDKSGPYTFALPAWYIGRGRVYDAHSTGQIYRAHVSPHIFRIISRNGDDYRVWSLPT
jgi:hypothetical protein